VATKPDEEIKPNKGNMKWTNEIVRGMKTPYTIVFEIMPTGTTGWTSNIFHKGGDDHERAPAVFFKSNSTALRILALPNGEGCDTDELQLNVWTKVTIIHNGNELKVFFGEDLVRQMGKEVPAHENNGGFYMSNPWDEPAKCTLKNFKIFFVDWEPGKPPPLKMPETGCLSMCPAGCAGCATCNCGAMCGSCSGLCSCCPGMPSLPSINLPSLKLPDFFCKPIPEEKACAKGNAVYTNDELKGMGTPFTWKFKVKFTGTRYCTTSLMHKAAEQRDRPAIKVPSGSYKLSVYCFKDYDQCVTTDSLSYQVWNDVCIIHDGTQCMVFVDNIMVRQARDPPPEANNGPCT
jgi:hypothetical protein